MRKYFVGFLVGLLLASAFPVYGAVSSLVGKKVQVEYGVVVNGKPVGTKAISIDGVSYSPNRAIADALGLEIGFENKQVVFRKQESDVVEVITPVRAELERVKTEISVLSGDLLKIGLPYKANDTVPEEVLKRMDDIKAQIVELEKRKLDLEAELTPTP